MSAPSPRTHNPTGLQAAVRLAPRHYRMPALPADAAAARAGGPGAALAFAIDAARDALARGTAPAPGLRALFVAALAELIRAALRPHGGDPAFQALLLGEQDRDVAEHLRLQAQAEDDRRTLRRAVAAIAHPGRLLRLPAGPAREALSRLHGLAAGEDWATLRRTLQRTAADHAGDGALAALQAHPALARLERSAMLGALDSVRRYEALRGPRAGSAAAVTQGAVSGRRGAAAEAQALAALRAAVDRLDRAAPTPPHHRIVSQLLLPAGFPGQAEAAKNEWDLVLLRQAEAGAAAELLLLAEVKSAPEAAAADLPRLLRGLQRLAQAQADSTYALPCRGGVVAVAGASLRRLQPAAGTLPAEVIYLCTAPAGAPAPLLGAASRGLLLAEPASRAFARAPAAAAPAPDALGPVWEALLAAPRLRPVLHQYERACRVRSAMLHPDDLLQAAAAVAGGG